MPLRERENDPRDQEPNFNAQGASSPDDNLAAQRAAGEAFFAAGDAAIHRAISGNSQEFNALVEQEGGQ